MRLSYCAAVLAALFCSPLLAEQQYRIELILFRQGPVLLASGRHRTTGRKARGCWVTATIANRP